jgi:hypothetical protein
MNSKQILQNKNNNWMIKVFQKGYIYCLSNPSYGHSIYKIGYTTKNPLERRAA